MAVFKTRNFSPMDSSVKPLKAVTVVRTDGNSQYGMREQLVGPKQMTLQHCLWMTVNMTLVNNENKKTDMQFSFMHDAGTCLRPSNCTATCTAVGRVCIGK